MIFVCIALHLLPVVVGFSESRILQSQEKALQSAADADETLLGMGGVGGEV